MLKKKVQIIFVLLILIGIALSYAFLHTIEYYKIENDSEYFVDGIVYPLDAGSKAIINNDGTLSLKIDDFEMETSSLPIYVVDNSEVILTQEMAYYEPSFNSKFAISKLPQLAEVIYDSTDKTTTITKNNDSKTEQNGFIYDGHNTYIFLEAVTVTYNDQTISLSPLSYAIVEDESWVQLYDEQSKEYYYEEISGDVLATCKVNNYTINLGKDVITYYEKNTIMSSSFIMLDDYFEVSE